MNNKLPPYFENMKPVLPRICDNYDIRRPSFHLPLIKHDFAEQLIIYQLTTMLNENGSTRFLSKVLTHSCSGFSYYLKNVIIDRYIINCNVINCVSFERVANHQAHVNVNNRRNTNEYYYFISYVAYKMSNYLYNLLFLLFWVCWRSGL